MFYNPLDEPLQRRIRLPLYYTGLTARAVIRRENAQPEEITLARDYSTQLTLTLPAHGRTWITVAER